MNARRDAGIDAVRAIAIAGVVLGHWLVTALVVADDGALHVRSPLAALPAAQPVTWLLQTLGLFFLAGGYAAATASARHRSAAAAGPRRAAAAPAAAGAWWRRLVVPRRLRALAAPVAALLGLLTLALTAGALAGVPEATLRTVAKLVVSPLWFLLPFLALTALVTPIARLVRRWGPLPPAAVAAAVVLAADLGHGFLPTTLVAAWAVPFVLGVALAQGRLGGRRAGCALLVCGAALPVYLWHQATMISVTVAVAWTLPADPRRPGESLPGLLAAPDGYGWAAARLAWLPLFAAALALVVRIAAIGPARGRRPRPIRTVGDQPSDPCHTAAGRGIESPMVRVPGRRLEVIAVRDSDPPSRSRAAVRSR